MKTTRLQSPTIQRADDPARHFAVPEGYFDSLADRLSLRLEAEEALRRVRLRRRRRLAGMVAGVAALLLSVPMVYHHYRPFADERETTALTDSVSLSDSNYEEYLLEEWADDNYYQVLYSSL